MKVSGPKGPKGVDKAKKTSKSSGADLSGFGALISTAAGEAEATQAAQNISRVDNLIAVQATEDPAAKASRQRMKKRAHDILDALEGIKMALINGNLRGVHLENIAHMVAQNREKVDDPDLMAVLDEIDLRAQVELAKLEMAKKTALEQLKSA